MRYHTFMLLSASASFVFGIAMLFTPELILLNLTGHADFSLPYTMQWTGCLLVTLAVINVAASNDKDSVALRAVMMGNVVANVLSALINIYQFYMGFLLISGLLIASVLQLVLIAGYSYYLVKMSNTSKGTLRRQNQ